MPRLRPPSYVLRGVDFGHLDAEEIRTLSVAKVTQQTTIDEYKTPTHEGLHDLRLGSFQAGRYFTPTSFSLLALEPANPPLGARHVSRLPGTASATQGISIY